MTDVEVKIELGHRAALLTKPTKENFTHEWAVYVRGAEKFNIEHFVEKVVFHLHPSFANPTRGMHCVCVCVLVYIYVIRRRSASSILFMTLYI